MRVVTDTNVLVSSFLSAYGIPAEILRHAEAGTFELVLSREIIAEFQEVMAYQRVRRRHHMSDVEIAVIVARWIKFATIVEAMGRLAVIRDDPDDDKFLEAAIAGDAEFIVSGDRHLLELKTYRGIRVVTRAVFLAILSADDTTDR